MTVAEPEAGCEPFTPVIVTAVTFCVDQVKVTDCPAVTVAGDATKLVTTGGAGLLPPELPFSDAPPQEVIPNTETAPTNSAVHNFQGPM